MPCKLMMEIGGRMTLEKNGQTMNHGMVNNEYGVE